MKSIMKTAAMLITVINLLLFSVNAEAQGPCKNNYNAALSYYQNGQFGNINNMLAGCIALMNGNRNAYITGTNRILLFRVYKLCISSYRNLNQDRFAGQKMEELLSFFPGNQRGQVQNEFNATALTPIN